MTEATGPLDITTELRQLAELARISRLGVNILDPATFEAAAATIEHLRRLDAKRQQEIERLLARVAQLEAVTTVSQALDEDRRDRDVTDIVTRLRGWIPVPLIGNPEVQVHGIAECLEAADEIERLRTERDEWQAEYHKAFSELGLAADEIERLRRKIAHGAEMIRMKDDLINKQVARIMYLEGVRG